VNSVSFLDFVFPLQYLEPKSGVSVSNKKNSLDQIEINTSDVCNICLF